MERCLLFGPLLRAAGSVERPLCPTEKDFKATGSGFFRDPGAKKAGYPANVSRRAGAAAPRGLLQPGAAAAGDGGSGGRRKPLRGGGQPGTVVAAAGAAAARGGDSSTWVGRGTPCTCASPSIHSPSSLGILSESKSQLPGSGVLGARCGRHVMDAQRVSHRLRALTELLRGTQLQNFAM